LRSYLVPCKLHVVRKGPDGGPWDAPQVRGLRRHLGFTQQRLARELGMRQQTVSEWEQGLYRPRGGSVTLLNLLAERASFGYDASSDDLPQPLLGQEGGRAEG